MPNYECERCFKIFFQKSHFIRHLGKKIKCTKKTLLNCDNCGEKFKFDFELTKHSLKCGGLIDKFNKLSDQVRDIKTKSDENEKTTEKIIKKNNKFRKKTKKTIKKLKERIKILEKNNNSTNNNNENNDKFTDNSSSENSNKNNLKSKNMKNVKITNNIDKSKNINILNFGSETLTHITEEKKIECVKKGEEGLIDFAKEVHLNPKAPQNNNIRLKDGIFQVYERKKWRDSDAECLLNNTDDNFDSVYDQVLHKIPKKELSNYNKYSDRMRNKHKNDVIDKFGKNIKKTLMEKNK